VGKSSYKQTKGERQQPCLVMAVALRDVPASLVVGSRSCTAGKASDGKSYLPSPRRTFRLSQHHLMVSTIEYLSCFGWYAVRSFYQFVRWVCTLSTGSLNACYGFWPMAYGSAASRALYATEVPRNSRLKQRLEGIESGGA
jgi:hypothetical protein